MAAELVGEEEAIAQRILLIRGQRVLLDADLAAMYGVTTKRFNEQVRRNAARFPADFSFLLEDQDFTILRSQFATSKMTEERRGGRRSLPRVFTEHGAIMAAMLLNSPRAIQMSVYVIRAFVKMRQTLASNAAMAKRLETLERSVAALDQDTRKQFDQVYEAIRGLMGSARPVRN
jgi:superfamily I DNA and RNA helicase